MTRLLDELSDANQFLLTFYGSKLALGFRGAPSFIERCFNLAYNTGMTNGRLHWLSQGINQRRALGYVVIGSKREKGGEVLSPEERLVRGLQNQFYQELRANGDITPLKPYDCETGEGPDYDEAELEARSKRLAEEFRATRIVAECFLEPPERSMAQVYGAPMAELVARRSFAPESFDA